MKAAFLTDSLLSYIHLAKIFMWAILLRFYTVH